MSKKICFRLFVIALITIMTSYVIGFTPITVPTVDIFISMQNPYLTAISILSILILQKKHYRRMLLLFSAILTALLLQFFSGEGDLLGISVLYKIIAFYVYVYLVILSRYMI